MKPHVAIVIKDPDSGRILFIKRSIKKKTLPGAYSFPSGTIEEGESPFETVIRECEEELGIKVTPKMVIAEKELPELDTKLIFVLCQIKKGEPVIKDFDEIERIEWMKFPEFFDKFSDDEIGHGLIWLRKNHSVWENI
jgi:mutator protein MutT